MAYTPPYGARPVIVLGTGGHAAVLVDALHAAGRTILGCVDPNATPGSPGPLGIELIGNDDALDAYPPDTVELANGIGATDAINFGGGRTRHRLQQVWRLRGYTFATIVHPSASIARACHLDDGVQVMAGAVIQTGSRIGAGSIVNTGARIDHDCTIGRSVHIAPGATLCGGITVAEGVFIGAGAVIIPNLHIGAEARIAAGMCLLGDVPEKHRLKPAEGIYWRPDVSAASPVPAQIQAIETNR